MNRRSLITRIAFAAIVIAALTSTTSIGARTVVDAPSTVPLIVDEALPGFHSRPKPVVISRGIAKFVTTVPTSATGMHGVGIDGGPYNNVKGAPVLPGRSSSLTVELPPGDYTVFDSYKSNRSRGYAVKVRVVDEAKPLRLPGRVCAKPGAFFDSIVRVTGVSCRGARRVGATADRLWGDSGETATRVTARGFDCRINVKSRHGLLVTCVRGEKKIRFSA